MGFKSKKILKIFSKCVIVQCHPIPNMVNDEVHRFSDIVKIYPNYGKLFQKIKREKIRVYN